MALKAERQKARQQIQQRPAVETPQAAQPEPPPAPQPDPALDAYIAVSAQQLQMLQQVVTTLSQTIVSMQQTMETQHQELMEALGRPIDVKSGDVDIHLPDESAQPPRPVSFTCEFDDGRTATLTPNYEDMT